MMKEYKPQVLKVFSFRRMLFPLLLGLLVAFFLIYKDKDSIVTAFTTLKHTWSWFSIVAIFLALCMMLCRDLAYMLRIRLLTGKKLSWRQSFQVIMLWEFASALTPSVVGGSAVALFIVSAEGIPAGKSTAIVLITALFDELFYIVFVPLSILFVGPTALFYHIKTLKIFGVNIPFIQVFIIGYVFILLLTMIIILGVFIRPHWFKKALHHLFSFRFLRRWRKHVDKWGDDMIITSNEMKGKKFTFWIKMFCITSFSWIARFLVVNFLILAINMNADQLLVFARQLTMWVILLISPTPGGSGVAEVSFPLFLGEFIPEGLASPLGILWRLISYYPYFFIGSMILPLWLKRVMKNKFPHV